MTAAVLTPFHGSQAVELGNRMWVKKILPVGDVEYKGRLLRFTRDYLGRLVQSFRSGAYDQVPFQLADAHNTHTNDPERTRGEITGMELRDDGLYVTAQVTPEGEQVLTANPKLGVSARIVEDYARSDGKHFPAAIQHVLGTLDPRIPGLGAWEAIEAASPVPDMVLDLSNESFRTIDLDWSAWNAERRAEAGRKAHDTASATARRDWLETRGSATAPAASLHGRQVTGRTAQGNTVRGTYDHGSGQVLGKYGGRTAVTHVQADTQAPAPLPSAPPASPGLPGNIFAGDPAGIDLTTEQDEDAPASATEGTPVPDLDALTGEQKARLAALLELPDDQLDALAAGGLVVTAEELEALTSPAGDQDEAGEDEDGDVTAAQIAAMSDEDFAALQAEWEAEAQEEPVGAGAGAGLSNEARFAIDLANARADEAAREVAVISARLAEEDYRAEQRRFADMGVPPFITELARPLLEGAGRVVEMANGKSVDAGQVMRRVLTEYAGQARLLDLSAEEGSPFDEPEGVADERAAQGRDDLVSRFKAATGLR